LDAWNEALVLTLLHPGSGLHHPWPWGVFLGYPLFTPWRQIMSSTMVATWRAAALRFGRSLPCLLAFLTIHNVHAPQIINIVSAVLHTSPHKTPIVHVTGCIGGSLNPVIWCIISQKRCAKVQVIATWYKDSPVSPQASQWSSCSMCLRLSSPFVGIKLFNVRHQNIRTSGFVLHSECNACSRMHRFETAEDRWSIYAVIFICKYSVGASQVVCSLREVTNNSWLAPSQHFHGANTTNNMGIHWLLWSRHALMMVWGRKTSLPLWLHRAPNQEGWPRVMKLLGWHHGEVKRAKCRWQAQRVINQSGHRPRYSRPSHDVTCLITSSVFSTISKLKKPSNNMIAHCMLSRINCSYDKCYKVTTYNPQTH
jgi:hypothetical protein